MQEIKHATHGRKGYEMALGTTIAGNTITVAAGAFKHNTQAYTLAAEQDYTPPAAPANLLSAFGYLVRDKTTNVIELMVDEVLADGADASYVFNANSPFEELYQVFHLSVPAGGPLTNVDCHTFSVIEGEF